MQISAERNIFMKVKKFIFSVFCAAILLCTGVVCLASANDEGISTCSTSNYSADASYNGVSLRIRGVSQAPASLSQIVNPSTTKKSYFGEVEVVRTGNGTKLDNTIPSPEILLTDVWLGTRKKYTAAAMIATAIVKINVSFITSV